MTCGAIDDELASIGMERAGRLVARRMASGAGRFWLHIDLDVLDMAVFPATDYLMPGGLTWEDLETLMAPIGRLPGLIGAAIACYSPEKDAGGACGRRLVQGLARILGTSGDRAV